MRVVFTLALVACCACGNMASRSSVGDASESTCDADIATLNAPDVTIKDYDATLPGCVTCVKDHCSGPLSTCSADCVCSKEVVEFVACVADGGSMLTECLTILDGQNGNAVSGCLLANCGEFASSACP